MNAFELMRSSNNQKKKPQQASSSTSTSTKQKQTREDEKLDEDLEIKKKKERDLSDLPWVEKYRPRSIESVEGQESTTRVLSKALNRADLPHMLFYGPPGTGKTSTILALARELFGPELMKSRILELNASDERGISVVREKIKNFAKVSISPATPGYPCPAFKIIILDEADSMTQDAQSALRRIMETYSKITRFCLICNYVTRIIEPIVSRCSKFRFKPISREDTLSKLKKISNSESIRFSSSSNLKKLKQSKSNGAIEDLILNRLIEVSFGDLRKSITFLQSLSKFNSKITNEGELEGDQEKVRCIELKDVEDLSGFIPNFKMIELLREIGVEESFLGGKGGINEEGGDDDEEDEERMDIDTDLTRGKEKKNKSGRSLMRRRKRAGVTSFEKIREVVEDILLDGYSAIQILDQLHDSILLNPMIGSRSKSLISMVFGEVDKSLNDGSDEFLQICNCCLRIFKVLKTSSS